MEQTPQVNFPVLVEYGNGGQDIFTRPEDIPNGCCFIVLKTNYVLEEPTGRHLSEESR